MYETQYATVGLHADGWSAQEESLAFQILTVLSNEPDRISRPSGENATAQT